MSPASVATGQGSLPKRSARQRVKKCARGDVRYWHKADMDLCAANVPLLGVKRTSLPARDGFEPGLDVEHAFPEPIVGEAIRSRVHFGFDDSDGLFNPASRAFAEQLIADALIKTGYNSLDAQAKALGLRRSTTWNITRKPP